MFTETWVGGFNVNVFAKWASTGVGCGGVCAPGVGVLRRYNPGFPGSKISLINGRGLKQGADLNKPSDPRALSAFPQHRGSKSPTRSVRDRAGTEADGARGLPSAETARRTRRAKAKSIQQATPSPILHLCSLAVPTSATTFPPERRRLRDLRWDGGRGERARVGRISQTKRSGRSSFPVLTAHFSSNGPYLPGVSRAGCPVGGIPRTELGHRQSPQGPRAPIVLAVTFGSFLFPGQKWDPQG